MVKTLIYPIVHNFPSCFEPHYVSKAKAKFLLWKLVFNHMQTKKIKTNFHKKSFAFSLAFINNEVHNKEMAP